MLLAGNSQKRHHSMMGEQKLDFPRSNGICLQFQNGSMAFYLLLVFDGEQSTTDCLYPYRRSNWAKDAKNHVFDLESHFPFMDSLA